MLTVQDAAAHFSLTSGTVRARIKGGAIRAQRINRIYRIEWADVWACEDGSMPEKVRVERYKLPLLKKSRVAEKLLLCIRSVERMIDEGLPTRNVWGSVRLNPEDVRDWMTTNRGIVLPEDWYI